MSDVMIIAAHPDDETLGCGATILRHKAEGDGVHWMIVTRMNEGSGWDAAAVKKRDAEIEKVSELYGFDSVHKLGFPTIRLDTVPVSELTSSISSVMTKVKPGIVYIPFARDIHTDHQIVSRTALGAMKNFRAPFIRRVLMYETLSETEFAPPLPDCAFAPNVFVDVSDFFSGKLEIMRVYASELMDDNLPRNPDTIEALGRLRGARIGKRYAEAFVLLEEIV